MSKTESYASVWDALSDTPEQAANLRARAELMHKIAEIVKEKRWTQMEAAKRCGVTQPRINDLLRGRVSRFPWTLWSISAQLSGVAFASISTLLKDLCVEKGTDALFEQSR